MLYQPIQDTGIQNTEIQDTEIQDTEIQDTEIRGIETQRIHQLDKYQKIYGVILLLEIIFRITELALTLGHNYPQTHGECDEILTNESLSGILMIIVFIGYFFANVWNTDPWKIRLMISATQCVQIGTGILGLITLNTISDQCRAFLVSERMVIWLGINLNTWILWFILGIDTMYLLFWYYEK